MPNVPEDKHTDKSLLSEKARALFWKSARGQEFGANLGLNQARQQKSELGKGAKKVGWVS